MDKSAIKELDGIFKERISLLAESEGSETKEMGIISFEDFKTLDLRVGEVKEAENIKGSDKLLRLTVDLGTEDRQIVAGIAQTHRPEELLGSQIVVLANMEPAKLFGVESQGMLLAADLGDSAVLLRPETKVEPGTGIR